MNADIFFDTNILLYAYANHEPKKKALAEDHIADALRYGIGVVSVQVLNEFIANASRKLVPAMTLKQAREEVDLLISGMRVVPLDVDDIHEALRLAQTYQINYWDALILASSHKAKCRTLFTEDLNHGQKFGHLQVKNPFI